MRIDVCKVLDLTAGSEYSSWGTILLVDQEIIIEYQIIVQGAQWRSMRFERCRPAPEGGLAEIRAGHEALIDEWSLEGRDAGIDVKAELICKEDISERALIRTVLGDLLKTGFPYSVSKEASSLVRRIADCSKPVDRRLRFQ